MSIIKILETLKKSDWYIKLKGKDGYHRVKDVVDYGHANGSENAYHLEDGTIVFKKDVEDLKIEALNKSDNKPKTPREENSETFKNEITSPEYVNARKSKIKNAGVDIANSARHKALDWKGLRESEISGEAEEHVKLKNLLKIYPPDIQIHSPSQVNSAVYGHHVIQKFPKEPKVHKAWQSLDKDEVVGHIGKHSNGSDILRFGQPKNNETPVTVGQIKEAARKIYHDTFKNVKDAVEESIKNNEKDTDISKKVRNIVHGSIMSARNNPLESASAEFLIDYHNKSLHWSGYKPKHNSAQAALYDFLNSSEKLPDDPSQHADWSKRVMEAAQKIVGGKSLTDLGLKEKKKTRGVFDPTIFYGSDAPVRRGPEYGVDGPENHTKQMIETMRIRGIQHGNSVPDKEREFHLKQTHDALNDLAFATGLPPEMVSFNGRLGLAFGARGKKRAMAHYEPDLMTINLTRHNGTGALAHEWGHFFDHILPKAKGHEGKGYASEISEYELDKYKEEKAKDISNSMRNIVKHLQGKVRTRMSGDFSNKNIGMTHDHFRNYWLSTKEMFARAFEKYIDHKLNKHGRQNTYLSGSTDSWLWPNKEEINELEPMFDELFNKFKNSEYLKKSLNLPQKLQKDVAQIKATKMLPSNQRPEQNVKRVIPSEQDEYGMKPQTSSENVAVRQLSTSYGKYGAQSAVSQMNRTPEDSGIFDPYNSKMGFTSSKAHPTTVAHEAHHKTVQSLVDKYGVEKINKLYDKLMTNIHPDLHPILHRTLMTNPSYKGMYVKSSVDPRLGLAYKEEMINLVHDIVSGPRRNLFSDFYKKNDNYIRDHKGLESFKKFDNAVKDSWRKIHQFANNASEEHLE